MKNECKSWVISPTAKKGRTLAARDLQGVDVEVLCSEGMANHICRVMSTQTLLKVHGVVYLTALTFVRRSEAKSGADEVAMWVATEVCDRGEVRPEITILSSALPVPATPILEVC